MKRAACHRRCVTLLAPPILAYLCAGCADQAPEQEVLRPVRSETITLSGGSRARSFSGMARAGQETDLSFRVPGRIEGLYVEVGDTVEAGKVIAQLERNDFEIAAGQARANLAEESARSRNAKADLERIRSLYESDNASKNDLDAALAQAQAAEAQVEASTQALEGAERQLAYTSLRAPVGGAIASVPVEVNENVVQGQLVVKMTSGSRPEVEVAIPGVLIAQIREGQAVEVTLDALPGRTFDAVVTEVGVSSTVTATTFPVTVRLEGANRDVRSGMAANVAFRFEDDNPEHIYVPSHAVGADRDGKFVFVLDPTEETGVGHVRRTAVEVGDFTTDGLQILSGVKSGDRVVTAGVRRLTDGQSVKLLDAPGQLP